MATISRLLATASFLATCLASASCNQAARIDLATRLDAKQRLTMRAMKQVARAAENYSIDYDRYPVTTSMDELRSLLEPTYVSSLPAVDAWHRPLRYVTDPCGCEYTIISRGSNGRFEVDEHSVPAGATPAGDTARDLVFSTGAFEQWPDFRNEPPSEVDLVGVYAPTPESLARYETYRARRLAGPAAGYVTEDNPARWGPLGTLELRADHTLHAKSLPRRYSEPPEDFTLAWRVHVDADGQWSIETSPESYGMGHLTNYPPFALDCGGIDVDRQAPSPFARAVRWLGEHVGRGPRPGATGGALP
jgi:hypothetical protein